MENNYVTNMLVLNLMEELQGTDENNLINALREYMHKHNLEHE